MAYEWGEDKREANLLRHGLDFRDAWRVLEADVVATLQVNRNGELRDVTMGRVTIEGEAATFLVVSVKRKNATASLAFDEPA